MFSQGGYDIKDADDSRCKHKLTVTPIWIIAMIWNLFTAAFLTYTRKFNDALRQTRYGL